MNTDVGTYEITVTATGPDGVTSSSVFNIIVVPDCTMQVVNPANLEAQTYLVQDPAASYIAPEFENDESDHCPLTYSHIYDSSVSWLTPSSTNEREMEWETQSNSDNGDYLI